MPHLFPGFSGIATVVVILTIIGMTLYRLAGEGAWEWSSWQWPPQQVCSSDLPWVRKPRGKAHCQNWSHRRQRGTLVTGP
jgi:hypothetical protein